MFKIKFGPTYFILAFVILSCVSCAAPTKQTQNLKQPKAAQNIVSNNLAKTSSISFESLNLNLSGLILDWDIEKNQSGPRKSEPVNDFSVFGQRNFLFGKEAKHGFERVSPRPERGMKEYSSQFSLSENWRTLWSIISLCLMLGLIVSIAWRGISLVSLFFFLWRRQHREELFAKNLIANSTLVPPVSLFLISETPSPGLLSEIRMVEKLEYDEVELIMFRDIQSKDEDALLLKDFRLRYRSPLYFADLDSEDPFEILEVQGERRILLVYSQKKDRNTSLTLFLKLARYPLVGFLNKEVVLYPSALSNLAYRWLRDGEKCSFVYGFIDDPNSNIFSQFLSWLCREEQFLTESKMKQLEDCLRPSNTFCLMAKNFAIQSLEFGGISQFDSIGYTVLPSYEIVGLRKPNGPVWLKTIITFLGLFWREGQNIVENVSRGLRARDLKLMMNCLAWLSAGVLWPLAVINYLIALKIHADLFENLGQALLFLAASECLILCVVALVWNLFSKNAIREIFPQRTAMYVRQTQGMAV